MTFFYRFRPPDALLDGHHELERQEIYFCPSRDLNDPMEGFTNLYWQGDAIVWRNLFKHYLLCLMRAVCFTSVSGKDVSAQRFTLATQRDYPILLTIGFLLSTILYLFWKAQCHYFDGVIALLRGISVADMGQFLSGVAGSVAFFWLVFGYYAQREQLRLQRIEMRLTREEMRAQREEFATLSGQASRDGFLRYLDVHEKQMATLVADLLARISNPAEMPTVERAWQTYANGGQGLQLDRHRSRNQQQLDAGRCGAGGEPLPVPKMPRPLYYPGRQVCWRRLEVLRSCALQP